jgi:thiamine phosphate synthase YjbQ (UPF0047 family)
MITATEYVTDCIRRGEVREAVAHCFWRAEAAAQVPEKTVDAWRDFKECLNRAIAELCRIRGDM